MERRQRGVTCRMSCRSILGGRCFPRGSRSAAVLLTDLLGKVVSVYHMRQVRYGTACTDRKRVTFRPIIHPSALGAATPDRMGGWQEQGWVEIPFLVSARGNPPSWTSYAGSAILSLHREDGSADLAIPRGWQLPAFNRTEEKICGLNLRHFLSLETRRLNSTPLLVLHPAYLDLASTLSATDSIPSPKLLQPRHQGFFRKCRIGISSPEALIRSARMHSLLWCTELQEVDVGCKMFCGGLRTRAAYPSLPSLTVLACRR